MSLLHGDIVHVEGMVSKAGKKFDADILINDEGNIEFNN